MKDNLKEMLKDLGQMGKEMGMGILIAGTLFASAFTFVSMAFYENEECRKNPPKFHYNTKIEISKGFYKKSGGIIKRTECRRSGRYYSVETHDGRYIGSFREDELRRKE